MFIQLVEVCRLHAFAHCTAPAGYQVHIIAASTGYDDAVRKGGGMSGYGGSGDPAPAGTVGGAGVADPSPATKPMEGAAKRGAQHQGLLKLERARSLLGRQGSSVENVGCAS